MEIKKIAFAFGRLNPPTSGHQLLVNKILEIAKKHDAIPIIFLSRTEDKKKNPLPFNLKIKMARKFFPEITFIDDPNIKNPINAFTWIANNGFEEVYFIAGSDRIDKYRDIAERNKTRFKVVELISSGDRDPDADDETGMSASKLRALAKIGDFASFRKGMPKNASEKDIVLIYNTIRDNLNEGLDELLEEFFNKNFLEKINERY